MERAGSEAAVIVDTAEKLEELVQTAFEAADDLI